MHLYSTPPHLQKKKCDIYMRQYGGRLTREGYLRELSTCGAAAEVGVLQLGVQNQCHYHLPMLIEVNPHGSAENCHELFSPNNPQVLDV